MHHDAMYPDSPWPPGMDHCPFCEARALPHNPGCTYRYAQPEASLGSYTATEMRDHRVDITLDERQSVYGPPAINFQRIADLLNVVFLDKLEEPFTAIDVGYISLCIKLGRLMQTPGHRDSLHDLKGYVACIEEILDTANKEPKP